MNFEYENISANGPTTLIAEHALMVSWAKQKLHSSVLEHLNKRLIDTNNKVAFYYLEENDRGAYKTFALIQNNQIIRFDVTRAAQVANLSAQTISVTNIAVPEEVKAQRPLHLELIKEALIATDRKFNCMRPSMARIWGTQKPLISAV